MVFRARRAVPLRALLLATGSLLSLWQARAQPGPLPVAGVDVYGTDAFGADEFRTAIEPDVRRYAATMEKLHLGEDSEPLVATLQEIDARVRAEFDARVPLAYFDIAVTTDFPALHCIALFDRPELEPPAYEILTKVSGEQYGERDYAAWERWTKTR
jgi:hypothetical protein